MHRNNNHQKDLETVYMKTILLPGKNNIQNAKPFAAKQMIKRFAFVLIGSTLITLANAQTDKRLVMAEKYFAAGEYYTAAGLYGQFLNPAVKSKNPTNFPLNTKRYALIQSLMTITKPL